MHMKKNMLKGLESNNERIVTSFNVKKDSINPLARTFNVFSFSVTHTFSFSLHASYCVPSDCCLFVVVFCYLYLHGITDRISLY